MAYDEAVAARVRRAVGRRQGLTEKKMFGGLAFLLRGHMCCGVVGDELMVRVGPEEYQTALANPHARPMDFTGKPLTGFVYIAPRGLASDRNLDSWLRKATAFVSTLPPK